LVKRKEEKVDSALQGNKLPLDIVTLIEGSCQSYCYSSIMIYQLVKAYFEGRLEEFMSEIKKERDTFLKSREE